MNKRMNPARPALPSGMVAVEKGPMREVVVGILSGNRIPAFGFDVDGYAPNHYRMVPYGRFGLLLGSKNAVEVRVLLDGKLLLEKQLYPAGPPSGPGIDEKVRAMMSERPEPFFIMEGSNGKPLQYAPHDPNLSLNEIVAEQIHPGARESPPSIAKLDGGTKPTQEFKSDLTPENLSEWLQKMGMPPMPPAPAVDATASGATPGSTLANASSAPQLQPGATAQEGTAVSETGEVLTLSETASPLPATVNALERSVNWAPSHGLVAIGVRMIQELHDMEPPRGPDAFTYVLFQLNPWNVHNKVHAKLMGRVIVPSREQMRKMMEEEGFASDAPHVPQVVCGGNCGHKHHQKRR
jgi:hypothetical protein